MKPNNYFSCMLRIWRTEDDGINAGTTRPASAAIRLMIQVEDIPSGEKHYFSDLTALNDFLEQHQGKSGKSAFGF